LPVRIPGVDRRVAPQAAHYDTSEHAKLCRRPCNFAGHALGRQPGFRDTARHQRITQPFEILRDRIEEAGAQLWRDPAVRIERSGCEPARAINLGCAARAEDRRNWRVGRGIQCAHLGLPPTYRFASD
jgi:hypothetical protein